MRYELRRIFDSDRTIGAFVQFRGHVSALTLRDYWYETPRINPWPPLDTLGEATVASVADEVVRIHRDIRVGEIESTPEMPEAAPDWLPAWRAIRDWLRA